MSLGISIAAGLLTAGGFGVADFAAKLSTDNVGFLKTALYMQIIGSFFVLPFALTDLDRILLHPSITLFAIGLGVANAVATLFLYKGFEVGRLSIVSPIASTAPVVAILLAVTFLGENITRELLIGIGLVICGVILVSIQTMGGNTSKQLAKGTAYAVGFMVLGGLLLFGLKPVSSVLGIFLPVLIMRWVSILVLAVPFLVGRSRRPAARVFRFILPVAFFDTFGNVAYNLGVTNGTVTIVSPLGGMFSAVTVLLAWVFLKEKPSRHQLIGFAALLVGVATLGVFG